jgi:DNA-binding response OmpR family regulator
MRVLLAADERTTARMLAKGLREQADAVAVAHDGNAAGARLADADCDIIVLDPMLPRRSGIDLCRRPRAAGNRSPAADEFSMNLVEDQHLRSRHMGGE